CGQACWHIVWHWVWNLRVARSVGCAQVPRRQMEWAPPHAPTGAAHPMAEPAPGDAPASGPLAWARARGGRLGAEAVALQDDGPWRGPRGGALWQSETRQANAFTRAAHVCGPRRGLPCRSPTLPLFGTDRPRHTRPTGERRWAPA